MFKVRDNISKLHSELEGQLRLDTIPMLWIDWLLLQNPFARFASGKAPLPEQKYPGLGLLNLVVPLIGEFAAETRKQAVLDIPEHFHGALFYSKWMKFFNPEMEGKLAAILRDLQGTPLPLISWGIRMDGLFNLSRKGFEDWKPGEQIYPLGDELVRYFSSKVYLELKEKAFAENKYRLDLDKIKSRLKYLDPDEKQIVETVVQTSCLPTH